MKGILLAGGSGSRLYPMTNVISKQLLPIYDKPMIYYPLSTLMLMGIKEILIISTPQDTPRIQTLLGNGHHLGLSLEYKIQEEPKGIAQALLLAEDFISGHKSCLILGDNFFYIGGKFENFKKEIESKMSLGATIISHHVKNPEQFGVIEYDKHQNVISIEEKPENPKSSYVSVGLYFYPEDVVDKAKTLQFSKRGELEITDLHNLYLKEKRLLTCFLGRGNAWMDTGTPESLMEAAQFIKIVEQRQGRKIGCIEEAALHLGLISAEEFLNLSKKIKNCDYKSYLINLYNEYNNESK